LLNRRLTFRTLRLSQCIGHCAMFNRQAPTPHDSDHDEPAQRPALPSIEALSDHLK
jgi:hypothetical protein